MLAGGGVIAEGSSVVLTGLQQRADLNGEVGVALSFSDGRLVCACCWAKGRVGKGREGGGGGRCNDVGFIHSLVRLMVLALQVERAPAQRRREARQGVLPAGIPRLKLFKTSPGNPCDC
jgi:hypothetical protein